MQVKLYMSCRQSFFPLILAGLITAAMPATADIVLTENDSRQTDGQSPIPGQLVMPEEKKDGDDKKEKCMTVCARWGEECTYVNRGAGGTTRKCRRACKQFTEECF